MGEFNELLEEPGKTTQEGTAGDRFLCLKQCLFFDLKHRLSLRHQAGSVCRRTRRTARSSSQSAGLAVGETFILLHPLSPLPSQ